MRNSFVFYASYADALKELSDADRLKVMDAMMAYALEGEEMQLQGVPKAIFLLVKPTMDANIRRYENGLKGAEHGAKGGRPRKGEPQENPEETPNEPQENPELEETETPKKDKDKEKDNENEEDYLSKKERNVKKTSTGAPAREDGEEGYISHADIMDHFGITGLYREILENYLRACYLNGHIVPNEVLRDLLSRLDKYYPDDEDAKILAIRKALNGGYYDIVELRDAPEIWR